MAAPPIVNFSHPEIITHNSTFLVCVTPCISAISMQKQGHIYYLGWKTPGIMGIIDASECVPTFGAGTALNRLDITDMLIKINVVTSDF